MLDGPVELYGLDLSYFTGKVEAYLRYRQIPYRLINASGKVMGTQVYPNTGLLKMPALKLADGRWLTDSTPMILWLETQTGEPGLQPADPALRYIDLLLEDFADEWLWRPALHYRWSYADDAAVMGKRIAQDVVDEPLPLWLKIMLVKERQRRVYVKGDGVTAATRDHVESIYLRTLDALEAIFRVRSFILGDRPSLADFGFFASMFRHFGIDPTPSRLMRERAPGVYEWLARMWNGSPNAADANHLNAIPDDLAPLMAMVADEYLPYLAANAQSFAIKEKRFDMVIAGTNYRNLPVSQYRVYARENLIAAFGKLDAKSHAEIYEAMGGRAGMDALRAGGDIPSGFDPEGRAPFGRPAQASAAQIRNWSRAGANAWGRTY